MGQLESSCTAPHRCTQLNHCVAVPVAFEAQTLKPGNHLIGSSMVETKPGAFTLCVRLDSTCTGPPPLRAVAHRAPRKQLKRGEHLSERAPVVAVQVESERKTLKPEYHFSGSRFETGRFQAMGQLRSTCTPPPRRGPARCPASAAPRCSGTSCV
jgi:hypothetical protein